MKAIGLRKYEGETQKLWKKIRAVRNSSASPILGVNKKQKMSSAQQQRLSHIGSDEKIEKIKQRK